MSRTNHERVAIVTGTSAGLGEAVAQQLLERGWSVIGIARRPFDPAANGWTKMRYRRGDVRDPAALEGAFRGADVVGTLHDMRFVFLDNDTKLLFATAYDGDWDAYIDDFATKIPDFLDIIDSAWEGWPGIRSPHAKDYLAKYQVAAEGWFVAHPDLTVAETERLKRNGKALDEFLDKISN